MVEVLNLTQKERWNNLLSLIPDGYTDIYFTPEYYEVYEKNGDGEALCFVFQRDGKIAMYPFLKNRIPPIYELEGEYFDIQGAYGYNGVVSSTIDESFISAFYENFYRYCEESKIIAEFTRFHPLLENEVFSNNFINVVDDRGTVVLDLLQDEDELWKSSYSSNNRNMIRKALKNNVIVEVADSEKAYDSFYEIYSETMENVDAEDYYFFDKKYFENFRKNLATNHKLLTAIYNEEIICSMLLMYKGDYAHYHLSGRRRDFSKLAANNLVLHHAINLAKQIGCKKFHFGGGTSSDVKDHLFRFKAGFSKSISRFKIGKKVHNQDIYDQVIESWEMKNPEKKSMNLLLKYRY